MDLLAEISKGTGMRLGELGDLVDEGLASLEGRRVGFGGVVLGEVALEEVGGEGEKQCGERGIAIPHGSGFYCLSISFTRAARLELNGARSIA